MSVVKFPGDKFLIFCLALVVIVCGLQAFSITSLSILPEAQAMVLDGRELCEDEEALQDPCTYWRCKVLDLLDAASDCRAGYNEACTGGVSGRIASLFRECRELAASCRTLDRMVDHAAEQMDLYCQ